MNRIEALKHVLQDSGYSEAEKDSARAVLKTVAETGESFHERETANHVLQSLDAESTTNEISISDELLCLLFLPEKFVGDPEQIQRAHLAYWKCELKKNDLSEQRRELALSKIQELEAKQ